MHNLFTSGLQVTLSKTEGQSGEGSIGRMNSRMCYGNEMFLKADVKITAQHVCNREDDKDAFQTSK